MKKFYMSFLISSIFFIFSLFSFSSEIKDIRINKYPPQLVFDLDETTPKYSFDYDDYNRLLFLEIGDTFSNKKSPNNILSKYINKIQKVNYKNSTGYFLKLEKNIFHRVSLRKNPNRLVIDFSKNSQNKQYTIVIDPGHGGKDPGAIGIKKTKEKDIVLAIGKYLRTELKKDFNVVMTRDSDEFISLNNRSKIANGIEADLFISLHVNSSKQSKNNGMEIFYFSKKSSPYASSIAKFENSFGEKYGEDTSSIVQIAGEILHNSNKQKSVSFADKLNLALSKRMKMKNRGIHGANFAVLRGINCPGVLVEVGFIVNKEDHRKITNRTNQKIIAEKIASHVRTYFY